MLPHLGRRISRNEISKIWNKIPAALIFDKHASFELFTNSDDRVINKSLHLPSVPSVKFIG
jgi:hypothetical protein